MINENYEKLKQALDLLRDYNYSDSVQWLNQGKPIKDAMALLTEIIRSEQKREQDEHAIAFAKEHKDSADPDIRRMSRNFLLDNNVYGEEE
tara:strand:+ start:6104 stop:6376 length:273 start_codon:yes stop_codon:yes gene_type:complete